MRNKIRRDRKTRRSPLTRETISKILRTKTLKKANIPKDKWVKEESQMISLKRVEKPSQNLQRRPSKSLL
jgi:hypothetical protein